MSYFIITELNCSSSFMYFYNLYFLEAIKANFSFNLSDSQRCQTLPRFIEYHWKSSAWSVDLFGKSHTFSLQTGWLGYHNLAKDRRATNLHSSQVMSNGKFHSLKRNHSQTDPNKMTHLGMLSFHGRGAGLKHLIYLCRQSRLQIEVCEPFLSLFTCCLFWLTVLHQLQTFWAVSHQSW